MDVVETFFEHHGILGQKWGIRNKENTLRKTSGDHKVVAKLRKKHVSELTNKQLQTANTRLNLTQNFNRLNPKKVSNGKRAAEGILATAGIGITAFNMFNSPAGKAFMSIGRKHAKRILIKPGQSFI